MSEYIEREATYEDFEKCNSENPKWTPSRVKTLLARQKSADVAPVRHAMWKSYGKNLGECSECGEIVSVRSNYCPNCGADMRGSNDE